MLPWKSIIEIEKNSTKPVYLQVADSIIKTIHNGQILPGQKLPGARVMGNLLNINRKTVVAAMDELSSQGWIKSYPYKGSFVSNNLPSLNYRKLQNSKPEITGNASSPNINHFPLLEPLTLNFKGKKHIDDGVPDVRMAPLHVLHSHYRSMLSKTMFSNLLRYNPVEGNPHLRNTLAAYLHTTRGIAASEENIFITHGSQMALYLTIATLLQKNENCITSFPGYQIVDNIIAHLGGNLFHVSVDEEGLVTEEIEKLCEKNKIKLLYITPHHHYPTTVTFSPKRRIELLQLAEKHRFYILEDDYDYDFHYHNSPVLPLASLNKTGHIIYMGSFSKCLTPSVRIGYFVAPLPIMKTAQKLRRIIDRQGDPLLERALSEFIQCGDLQRHLKKVVKLYKHRRDYFSALLQQHLSEHIIFTKPEGGMSVWLIFKNSKVLKDFPTRLAEKGYFLETDNIFVEKLNGVRIGFASLNDAEMVQFVQTLKLIFN